MGFLQITNYAGTVRELVKCLKPGGMLILIEGDVEWHNEDQAHLAVPADPNCPDQVQPGKTWIGQNAHGMRQSSSLAFIYTTFLSSLMNISDNRVREGAVRPWR